MKRILLKSIILSVAFHFAFAGNIWADDFGNNSIQKATENFGSNNVSKAGYNTGLDNPDNSGQTPISGIEPHVPIGTGLGILSSLGLAYGCFLFLRKKKRDAFT